MSVDVKTELATRIKTAIDASSFTPDDLAPLLGVRARTIYRWQSGETVPTIAYLAVLARVLDLAISTFLEEKAA
jgi:ribosome-binding protein aMBF1 (putative translation factor)